MKGRVEQIITCKTRGSFAIEFASFHIPSCSILDIMKVIRCCKAYVNVNRVEQIDRWQYKELLADSDKSLTLLPFDMIPEWEALLSLEGPIVTCIRGRACRAECAERSAGLFDSRHELCCFLCRWSWAGLDG